MIQMWIHLANNKWIRYGRQFPFYGLAAAKEYWKAERRLFDSPFCVAFERVAQ